MASCKNNIDVEVWFAWLTAIIVASSAIVLMYSHDKYPIWMLFLTATCFVCFMIAWQQVISDNHLLLSIKTRWLLVAGQYFLVLVIFYIVPYAYTAILLTLWSVQLPLLLSFQKCLIWSPIWSLAVWALYGIYWGEEYAVLTATLFWTFNVFALIMVNIANKEKQAREAAQRLNRELSISQSLLAEASKQSERIRIARNIHDLLGHHLTALTINLQVAERLSDGDAKAKVIQCYSLAKLLLGDVRDAVCEIREKSDIDIFKSLLSLKNQVDQIEINIDVDDSVLIQDVSLATLFMRCAQEAVTNCLKHSSATTMFIKVFKEKSAIGMHISDNGYVSTPIEVGNGLRGMHERVSDFKGNFTFNGSLSGFNILLLIPESAV